MKRSAAAPADRLKSFHIGTVLGLYWGYIGTILGLYWGYIEIILGLYWGCIGIMLGLYWGYMGFKKMCIYIYTLE